MHKLTITIENDPDIENPCDFDSNWKVISFNSRHTAYENPDNFFTAIYGDGPRYPFIELRPNDIGLRRKLAVGTAFILSAYEHGNIAWSLEGEGMQCNFDTADIAGLLVWEHPVSEMGAKTLKDRAEDARKFLETYNSWSNGHGLWYSVESMQASGDIIEDSCGGFYGCDTKYMYEDNIASSIQRYLDANPFLTSIEEIEEDDAEDEDFEPDESTLYIVIKGDCADYTDLSDVFPAYRTFNAGQRPLAAAA